MTILKRFILLIKTLVILLFALPIGCSSKEQDHYKDMTAEQIYLRGKDHVAEGRYPVAIKDFEALEARYPYGEYAEKGQLALIFTYYEKSDYAQTYAAADRFIKLNPFHENVDYAYYMKGLANFQENLTFSYRRLPLDRAFRDPEEAREAFNDFKSLIENYPDSQYAKDARQRMIYLKDQLARHELHVAEYYMKRKAYLAAANRGAHIVNHFEQTSAVPDALVLMKHAYDKLGMHALAKDAETSLTLNYPEKAKTLQ